MKALNGNGIVRLLAFLAGVFASGSAVAAAVVYNDEAAFRAAAGAATTYGFETNSVTEGVDIPSPLPAASLDDAFDIAYTGLDSFQVIDQPASPFAVDGTHFLFTHSQATAASYTLTFSNFGGAGAAIAAFGLTVVDFASNLALIPAAITYDTGALSGTLFVSLGQPDYTHNFVGLVVGPGEAFTSITLTLDDVRSGMQSFDEVIYARPAPIPEPGTLLLTLLAGALFVVGRRPRAG